MFRPDLIRHCEAKRSNPEFHPGNKLDCFVACAPRNDGISAAAQRCLLHAATISCRCSPRPSMPSVTTSPDIEILRRLHAGADAGRGAGGDDVAGQQRHELRDVGNALRHREDHGRGRPGLAALAVDVEPHRQLLHVGDFVLGDEPRAERPKGVVRLALGPLPQPLDLEIALGDVVADAIAGNMVERVGFGDIFGAGADDGGDLDFPVELGRAARLLDRIVGAAQSAVLAFRKKIGSDGIGLPVSLAWSL